jgi:hypothetical protein
MILVSRPLVTRDASGRDFFVSAVFRRFVTVAAAPVVCAGLALRGRAGA